MTDVSIASSYARRLVEKEARSDGVGMKAAAAKVARGLRVSPSAIWALLYAPPKRIASDLFRKLHVRVERSLEFEIQALAHELDLLRQQGVDPRDGAFGEVETHLAAARRALNRRPHLVSQDAGRIRALLPHGGSL